MKRASEKAMHCGGGCGPPVKWTPHQRSACSFCTDHTAKATGKRHAKQLTHWRAAAPQTTRTQDKRVSTATATPTQQPASQTSATQLECGLDVPRETVYATGSSQHTATIPLNKERFINAHTVQQCNICSNIVDNVIEVPCCEEYFCADCMCEWLATHKQCPACANCLKASELKTPGKVPRRMMDGWTLRCDFHKPSLQGCPVVTPLRDLRKHVAACQFNPATTTAPIRTVRQSSTVEDVLSASPSKLCGNVADRLTGHLVAARVHDGRLEVRTASHGKPQVYQRAVVSNVPSDRAADTTLRRRSSELTRHAETVCGGVAGARAQEVAGLQRLSAAEQEQLLLDAGIKAKKPSPGSALAIKADLSLPWSQLRKLRRWLHEFGVEMESEKTVRTFIASKLPSYTAKELPMTDKDGGVTMIATVLFPNLVDIVIFFLDQLQDSSRLTWHGGAIPESEIWIKIGGDHGGGSFKLSFQIVNTEHPNSLTNIIPFCIFNGKDTPANLETALGQYRPQLQQLQQTSWKGKTMKIYLFGDYEFQTVNFGLSGSSGLRPCLHCLCTKKSMELESDAREEAEREPRTLASLASDHSQYVAAGSKLAQAKKYNNVIRPIVLPVSIPNVIIPVLHLDLGIYPWLFEAMRSELRILDLALVARSQALDTDGAAYKKLCDVHSELTAEQQLVQNFNQQLTTTQEQLEFVALHVQQQGGMDELGVVANLQEVYQTAILQRDHHQQRSAQLQQQVDKLSGCKQFCGPCVAALEPVLQLHGIERQVYHGGAFVGNHIHEALKPTVVTAITSAHLSSVQTRCPDLCPEATKIADRYVALMNSYATCRAKFSHCKPVDDADLGQLQQDIEKFLALCRNEVVSRKFGHITPKLHLLEEHTVPLMKRVRVGLGLLAEQGAESLHSSLNSLNFKYKSIPRELLRLQTVAAQHLLTTTNEAIALRPAPRKRKSQEQ